MYSLSVKEVVRLIHVIIAFSMSECINPVPNTAGTASLKTLLGFVAILQKVSENEELNLICEYWKTGIMGLLR